VPPNRAGTLGSLMKAGRGHRPLLGAMAGLLAVLAVALPARAGTTGDPLLPDLVTLHPLERDWLRLYRNHAGRQVLRLSNRIANVGSGPMELFSDEPDAGCDSPDDRSAWQRLFQDLNGNHHYDAGEPELGAPTEVGCFRFHPAHGHWHFQQFARYEIRSERTGKQLAVSQKVGFCLLDGDRRYADRHPLPGAPAVGHYPIGQCQLDQPGATEGLSIGWADSYGLNLPGQRIDVSGLPRGRYCLVSTANPAKRLTESNYANDARATRIRLNPSRERVRALGAGCRIPS
jgi:Lysyl oxidase